MSTYISIRQLAKEVQVAAIRSPSHTASRHDTASVTVFISLLG